MNHNNGPAFHNTYCNEPPFVIVKSIIFHRYCITVKDGNRISEVDCVLANVC